MRIRLWVPTRMSTWAPSPTQPCLRVERRSHRHRSRVGLAARNFRSGPGMKELLGRPLANRAGLRKTKSAPSADSAADTPCLQGPATLSESLTFIWKPETSPMYRCFLILHGKIGANDLRSASPCRARGPRRPRSRFAPPSMRAISSTRCSGSRRTTDVKVDPSPPVSSPVVAVREGGDLRRWVTHRTWCCSHGLQLAAYTRHASPRSRRRPRQNEGRPDRSRVRCGIQRQDDPDSSPPEPDGARGRASSPGLARAGTRRSPARSPQVSRPRLLRAEATLNLVFSIGQRASSSGPSSQVRGRPRRPRRESAPRHQKSGSPAARSFSKPAPAPRGAQAAQLLEARLRRTRLLPRLWAPVFLLSRSIRASRDSISSRRPGSPPRTRGSPAENSARSSSCAALGAASRWPGTGIDAASLRSFGRPCPSGSARPARPRRGVHRPRQRVHPAARLACKSFPVQRFLLRSAEAWPWRFSPRRPGTPHLAASVPARGQVRRRASRAASAWSQPAEGLPHDGTVLRKAAWVIEKQRWSRRSKALRLMLNVDGGQQRRQLASRATGTRLR